MQSSKMSFKNMMVAPHHLAAKTGSDILKEGGNAIAVSYTHLRAHET